MGNLPAGTGETGKACEGLEGEVWAVEIVKIVTNREREKPLREDGARAGLRTGLKGVDCDRGREPVDREVGPLEEEHRGKIVPVEAYSGYRGNERPVAFRLDGKRIRVRRILERRRTPDFDEFRVETEEDGFYRIARHRRRDLWSLR